MNDKPMRILIVDDSPEDRAAYRRRMARDSSSHYQFLETSLGEDGIALAQKEKPDCILLDYNLPDLNGLTFLDRLRHEEGENLTPVIMLTGQGNETIAVESLKRGAQDYLVKSAGSNDLLHVVHRAVERVALHAQRKQAEDELRKSQEEFRAMANSIPQLAWMARPDGWIFWYNQRWHDYCGSTPQQMEGWGWKAVHDPAHIPRIIEKWQHALATATDWEDTFPLRRCDGQFRWHLSRARAIRNEQGEVSLWFGTNTDITNEMNSAQEREKLLESERAAREESERAGRMKDEFLATLSHELRTPLNAILGWSQLIQRALDDRQMLEEGLAVIERNARVQVQLIEDLLDMSRIISGKIRLDVRSLDPASFVNAALETVAPSAEARGVRLQKVLDHQPGLISGDQGRLQQIIWNLLSNAIKFTTRGGRVQVIVRKVNSHIEISVTDTGQGIAAEFLPHVFERFRQADASTTRKHGGLGLGLAIAKQLVELHGGTIQAASDGEGHGSTFTVALPIAAVKEDGRLGDATQPRALSSFSSHASFVSLNALTILVVDDDPDARDLIRRVLELGQATVITAASADEGLHLLQCNKLDILLSDIGMPKTDGYDFLKQVRSLSPAHGGAVPAIALTAFARSEDRTRALLAGYLVQIAKPVEPQELVATIASVAGRTGAETRS